MRLSVHGSIHVKKAWYNMLKHTPPHNRELLTTRESFCEIMVGIWVMYLMVFGVVTAHSLPTMCSQLLEAALSSCQYATILNLQQFSTKHKRYTKYGVMVKAYGVPHSAK